MWVRFRKWKHGVTPALIIIAYAMLRFGVEGSAAWYAGLLLGVGMGLFYVIEEVVWNLREAGRPCAMCSHQLPMTSFHVQNICPNCGTEL